MASVANTGTFIQPRQRSSSDPNGQMVNGRMEINLAAVNNSRLKRKARRMARLNSNSGENSGLANVSVSYSRFAKNSRRSRNGFGRGLPKKGGAGGKGTWGKPGIELMLDDDDVPDIHDPNYDPENQNCELVAISPQVSEGDLEKTVEPTIYEYFDHGDSSEVILLLQDLNLGVLRPQLVSMAISMAMERKPSHCEMTSILLSDMYGHLVSQDDIAMGFDILIHTLSDLILDTPDAALIVGNFVARAVADDCLPPKFVQSYKGKIECPHARTALEHADALLNMKHGLVRLDNVWGVGGGMRPVKYLINQMQLLLKEYLCSGDTDEACKCLQELEVPHFHHEIVYEALLMVIEDMGKRPMELICKLLKVYASSVIVTPDQMLRGFLRVFEEMPDICIDVPPAYNVLDKFISMCNKSGFISEEVFRKMPNRGRKRFVSEGDGGLIKTSSY